ncbi:GAF domain-containing protein [Chitinasiproducens palmae]|uniref:GAF domain-containing protein n=1 Tax=Chitinasiproducens palmae TaxID=1770053 RepID=A0A1H2PPU6_9BURK|nr:GAF domain-containing protein [Chitinasiproducens palmae]SDV48827.1 hypothetical protein SAMN05216551_10693 [Chitinasiproducens palmae]
MERNGKSPALSALERVAEALRENHSSEAFWKTLETSLTAVFGQRLFTVLAFDTDSRRLCRLYSNRPDINPVGGIKRVTQSRWTEQVLVRGELLIGSNREDIKSVFSEYETLWSIGCESVLNIPVRTRGVTVGTLNLLDAAGAYDHADQALAAVFGQLAASVLKDEAARLRGLPDPAYMEQV